LADADTLFVRAVQRFKLHDEAGAAPVESLKRRVLRVTKPRDTKLLQISVTLGDPAKAQAVVQFIAEETVSLNHSLARQSDEEFITQAHRQAELARAQLDETDKRLTQQSAAEALESELAGLRELKRRLQREVTQATADLADYGAQLKTQPPAPDSDRLRRDVAGIAARAEALRKEIDSVTRSIKDKQSALANRQANLERIEADRRSARAAYDTAIARWNEAESTAGNRGERLKVIDPGIVPQRPSSPNLPLNVFASLFIACIAALLYVSVRFVSESRAKTDARRAAYR
jgi:capsule polysaccharide export protein KpsE/RkpR